MKVNIVSGPFIDTNLLIKLIPNDKSKTIIVKIKDFIDLSKQVRKIGATTVTTIGHKIEFKEGM